ncbi:MAG TPA: EamA family transporter [Thermoanaerobaculia bacterium]|nr:EamA family transporter [Thermoanaerobaculia bacterium]
MARPVWPGFLALTLIWGTTWAVIRIGLEGLPPFAAAALRFAVAAAVLAPVVWKLRIPLGAGTGEKRLWLASTVFNFIGSYGVVYWAEQYVPSALAAVIFATFPLFVSVLAHFFLPAERLGGRQQLGVFLGFVGVVLLFSDDLTFQGGPMLPVAAAVFLLSPFCSAVGQILIKRWGEGVHPLSLALVPQACAALFFTATTFTVERPSEIELTVPAVLSFLYLGAFGSALAFYLYFTLLKRMPATRLALITYLNPVVAVAVGSLFMGERLGPSIFAGAAAILLGVALASRGAAKPTA